MPELRITGGELGGRRIQAPKGGKVRPTTEKVREAVFSILGDVSGARVLDLFCGTGALAIEALSRGASTATLVDIHPRLARENVERLELAERATVVRADVVRFLRKAEQRSFDLVLCDPPYGRADRSHADRSGAGLDPLLQGVLAKSGRAMIESSPESPLQIELPLLTERSYGDTLIRVYGAPD
jgi:16S rRNA (guanine966-N2)-methyltransferase